MLWYTSIIRLGTAKAVRDARDPIEKWWISRSSGSTAVDHVAVVRGQVFEARVGGFDEDLGVEPGFAEHPADAKHLVADRVAVAQRRQDLMHARHQRVTGPAGTASSTARAGGSDRRPRASHPESGAMAA